MTVVIDWDDKFAVPPKLLLRYATTTFTDYNVINGSD